MNWIICNLLQRIKNSKDYKNVQTLTSAIGCPFVFLIRYINCPIRLPCPLQTVIAFSICTTYYTFVYLENQLKNLITIFEVFSDNFHCFNLQTKFKYFSRIIVYKIFFDNYQIEKNIASHNKSVRKKKPDTAQWSLNVKKPSVFNV